MARRTAIKEKNITRTCFTTIATVKGFNVTTEKPEEKTIELDGKYVIDNESDIDDVLFSAKTDTFIAYKFSDARYIERKYSMPISLFKAYATEVKDADGEEEEE